MKKNEFSKITELLPAEWEEAAVVMSKSMSKGRFLASLPQWLENRCVCLADASDKLKPGRKGADYRLSIVFY